MEKKKRSRLIWWLGGSGLALITLSLVLAALLISNDEEEPTAPTEPSIPAAMLKEGTTKTAAPTTTPSASPTPSPTQYRLPLAPITSASPSASTKATAAPSPTATAAADADPLLDAAETILPALVEGLYESNCKDLLVVGTENGVATAVALVRIRGDTLHVIAIPYETMGLVYTLDSACRITAITRTQIGRATLLGGTKQQQRCWNLVWTVKNLTGVRAAQWLCVDMACLPALMEATGGAQGEELLFTADNITELMDVQGEQRADLVCELATAAFYLLRGSSLWELPAIRKAAGSSVSSSLSLEQLIALARSLSSLTTIKTQSLPVEKSENSLVVQRAEAEKILSNLYN